MSNFYEGENKGLLANVSASSNNPHWEQMIYRESPLYVRNTDVRSPFQRDLTRILYSNAYKRLKSKTQVFFSPSNDHVCTRIEHVNHVESISYTIAHELGLNVELTRAISMAHDLGHAPFGHQGEKVLNELAVRDAGRTFWHEKNGLNYVDNIDLLDDAYGFKQNLNLTYAVRDGIVSHCGEINQERIKPRETAINLDTDYDTVAKYEPYTWEGCVVKISDKISYIVRDIEDAIRFNILSNDELFELKSILNIEEDGFEVLNNTNVTNDLVCEVLKNVTVENGFAFSQNGLKLMDGIKDFNYNHIYLSDKLVKSHDYFKLIINTIYNLFSSFYNKDKCIIELNGRDRLYSDVIFDYFNWLKDYSIQDYFVKDNISLSKIKNKKIFDLDNPQDYYWSIILYISGMTDNCAIETFDKIISF